MEQAAWSALKLDRPDPRIKLLFGQLSADHKTFRIENRDTILSRDDQEYWYALLAVLDSTEVKMNLFGFITRPMLLELATKQDNEKMARRLTMDESSSSNQQTKTTEESQKLKTESYSERMIRRNNERVERMGQTNKMNETQPKQTHNEINKATNKLPSRKETTISSLFSKFAEDVRNWSAIWIEKGQLARISPPVLSRPLMFASSTPSAHTIDAALLAASETNGLSMDMTVLPGEFCHRQIKEAPGAEDIRGVLIRNAFGGDRTFHLCSCRLYVNPTFTCYTFIHDYPSFTAAVITVYGMRIIDNNVVTSRDSLCNDLWTFFCTAYVDELRMLGPKPLMFSSSSNPCRKCRDQWHVKIQTNGSLARIICDEENH